MIKEILHLSHRKREENEYIRLDLLDFSLFL